MVSSSRLVLNEFLNNLASLSVDKLSTAREMTIMDKRIHRSAIFLLLITLMFTSLVAHADLETTAIFDKAHDVYFAAAASWASVIKLHATRLFWTLALISMVWTFGMLALRNADTGEFFAEFIRFTIFTGFYWWLLDNGPAIAQAIITSLRTVGSSASAGSHASVYPLPSPSDIVDIGFIIFGKALLSGSVWSIFASIVGALLALLILIILSLIAINVLITLISAWVLAYAGIFFLGFGGCRWTSDMAISYFKTVIGIGVQLLAMTLLVGVGQSFIDLYYAKMSPAMKLPEMGAFTVIVLIMLALINKIPPLLAGLVTGGGTGALGGGFGARDAVAAATMAGAAISATGAALTSAAANVAGGAQALMAAISKGSEAESPSGSIARDFMQGQTGSESQGGGIGESPLAQAMGDNRSQNGQGSSTKASEESTSGSTGSSQKTAGSNGESNKGSASSGTKANGKKPASQGGGAKAARVAMGAAGALASGVAQVAKTSFNARVANTIGGKVAQAIRDSNEASKTSDFSNSLSAGSAGTFDPDSEVAAFRDRNEPDSDDPGPSHPTT